MPARASSTRSSTSRARGAGQRALKRLQDSVDATEAALKDLRKEMGRGSRELLHDFDRTFRDARKNLRRVSNRIAKDLEQVQAAAAGRKATPARRTATRRSTTSSRRSSTTRTKK